MGQKKFGPRLGLTKGWVQSGSKLFDILMPCWTQSRNELNLLGVHEKLNTMDVINIERQILGVACKCLQFTTGLHLLCKRPKVFLIP